LFRGLVLMMEWSENDLRRKVEAICEECVGPTGPIVASRLSRYMPWEFEYKLDRTLWRWNTQVVTNPDDRSLEALTARLEAAGCQQPVSWARSEVDEDIAQTTRFLFLGGHLAERATGRCRCS
jgi:hypothetical protein